MEGMSAVAENGCTGTFGEPCEQKGLRQEEPQVYALTRGGSGWELTRRDFIAMGAAAAAGAAMSGAVCICDCVPGTWTPPRPSPRRDMHYWYPN